MARPKKIVIHWSNPVDREWRAYCTEHGIHYYAVVRLNKNLGSSWYEWAVYRGQKKIGINPLYTHHFVQLSPAKEQIVKVISEDVTKLRAYMN